MQKKKGKEGKFKGRSQGYRKMLSEMAILLVGFTKSLPLSYCEELVLSEVDCPCLCQSWVSFQKWGLSQKLPDQWKACYSGSLLYEIRFFESLSTAPHLGWVLFYMVSTNLNKYRNINWAGNLLSTSCLAKLPVFPGSGRDGNTTKRASLIVTWYFCFRAQLKAGGGRVYKRGKRKAKAYF